MSLTINSSIWASSGMVSVKFFFSCEWVILASCFVYSIIFCWELNILSICCRSSWNLILPFLWDCLFLLFLWIDPSSCGFSKLFLKSVYFLFCGHWSFPFSLWPATDLTKISLNLWLLRGRRKRSCLFKSPVAGKLLLGSGCSKMADLWSFGEQKQPSAIYTMFFLPTLGLVRHTRNVGCYVHSCLLLGW